MSNKHYQEQKMLMENFRKWQEQEEPKEPLDEGVLADIYNTVTAFFEFVGMVYEVLQYMSIGTATAYTIAPYLKIAVHHPKVQEALETPKEGESSETTAMFRAFAVGLKKADFAGQFVQEFANSLFAKADAEGKKIGIMTRLKSATSFFIFMAVLASTSFPIVGSVVAGMLPKVILKIRKVTKSAIKKAENTKARIEGRPTPDEQAEINAKIERELKELQELEEQESLARARAESVVDIIESIKRDPLKAAEELGVELSEKDIENMRLSDEEEPEKQSRAKKVNIPSRDPAKRKLTPDEVAARKAAADANRAARLGK